MLWQAEHVGVSAGVHGGCAVCMEDTVRELLRCSGVFVL